MRLGADVRDDEHPEGTPDRRALCRAVQHRYHDELPPTAFPGGQMPRGVSDTRMNDIECREEAMRTACRERETRKRGMLGERRSKSEPQKLAEAVGWLSLRRTIQTSHRVCLCVSRHCCVMYLPSRETGR